MERGGRQLEWEARVTGARKRKTAGLNAGRYAEQRKKDAGLKPTQQGKNARAPAAGARLFVKFSGADIGTCNESR